MQTIKFFLILTLSSLLHFTSFGQCSGSIIKLTTQAQVDNFSTNNPGCTELGKLTVMGSGITNLNALSSLQKIDHVIIQETNLTDLSGLDNLTESTAAVTIISNPNLISLDGLNSLVETGTLTIESNQQLMSISGLSNLLEIYFRLFIDSNPSLKSLTGLEGSTLVGAPPYSSKITITNNDALTSLAGLPNVSEIDFLTITFNDALVNFGALSNLTRVNKICEIFHNPELSSLAEFNMLVFCRDLLIIGNSKLPNLSGFENLTSVHTLDIIGNTPTLTSLTGLENLTKVTELRIYNNDGLTSMNGLNGLTEVVEFLIIRNNNGLVDLKGFDNLTDIGNANSLNPRLTIWENGGLQSLDGLQGISSIDESLSIENNSSLTDLTGIDNITSLGDLDIRDNDALVNLDVLSNLSNIERRLYILRNSSLVSILGLSALNSIPTQLYYIVDNPLLALCHAEGICTLIVNNTGVMTIQNNAPGCFDESEVEVFCGCVRYYFDNDGDGYGTSNSGGILICDGSTPSSYIDNNLDCNDNNSNDVHLVITNDPVIRSLSRGILTIESTGGIGTNHALFTFQAGESILLDNGFNVQPGASFLATIESCGSSN